MTTNEHTEQSERAELIRKAMRRAFSMGQTYWQQADSDYTSQHRKADETQAKFRAFVDETAAALLAADKPAEIAVHPDDAAVDRFASAMKEKLAQARKKGRGGWQECDPGDLSRMLRDHVEKGDPRDVANFCAFLWNLGWGIDKPEPQAQAEEPETFDTSNMDALHWAKEFASRFTVWSQQHGVESDTAGLMLGWFANAIMAGYDEANRRNDEAITKQDAALQACVEALETCQMVEGVTGWEYLYDIQKVADAITQAQEARK